MLTLRHHIQPCTEFFKVAFYTAGWFKLHLERRSWDLEIDWDGTQFTCFTGTKVLQKYQY